MQGEKMVAPLTHNPKLHDFVWKLLSERSPGKLHGTNGINPHREEAVSKLGKRHTQLA